MKKWMGLALGALLAVPAFAGGGQKCTQETQACLNHFSEKRDGGWTGLELEKMDAAGRMHPSPMVKKVADDGPAKAAGIRVGDFLLTLNGAKLSDAEAMKKARENWKPGAKVVYTVQRSGKELAPITLTLARMPEDVFTRMVGQHMIENHMSTATAEATPAPPTEAAPAQAVTDKK